MKNKLNIYYYKDEITYCNLEILFIFNISFFILNNYFIIFFFFIIITVNNILI